MKKYFLKSFVLVAIVFAVGSTVNAQIVVRIRPAAPVMVRPVAPARAYIWVDGEWIWRGGAYRYKTGYWVVPRRGFVWNTGYWRHSRHGWIWKPGHWRRGR